MNKHVLYYRGSKLDNVSNYKYLGLQFSTNVNFSYAKREIKKVALKALSPFVQTQEGNGRPFQRRCTAHNENF